MRDYAELVKALRYCSTNDSDAPCNKQCPYYDKRDGYECIWEMMRKTADAIEELVAQRDGLLASALELMYREDLCKWFKCHNSDTQKEGANEN